MTSALQTVVRALVTHPPQVDEQDVAVLRQARIAGEVRQRLPEGHPVRALLRNDHLALGTRHALVRAEVQGLMRVWAAAGIDALLMKGFALAEFEYATPGERFYGDVDVLIPDQPETISRAVHVALAHGWRSDGQHARPQEWTHECAHLYSPGGHVRLDVHRFVIAWVSGPTRRVQALTQAVWAQAQRISWEGVPVWRPHPLDAVVVNLAFGRSWGGDGGGLKPADYPDLRLLTERHGLTDAALTVRADALGGHWTWRAFRQVCDPQRRHFALGEAWGRSALLEAIRRDGMHLKRQLWRVRWRVLPQRLRWMLRVAPDVYWAWKARRQGGDPRQHLARWTPQDVPSRWAGQSWQAGQNDPQVVNLISAVNWLTRLVYPRQSRIGVCVPRAYATYRALRRWGYPVVFVSGVARNAPGQIIGHAWIEQTDGELEAYGEPMVSHHFRPVFRYPESQQD